MRTFMRVTIPVEAGNRSLADGSLPKVIEDFVARMRPEAAYFLPNGGKRSALFVFDLQDASTIPTIAEDFFQSLDASIEISPVMNLEDLRKGLASTKHNGSKAAKRGRAAEAARTK